jgi:hypothetical protein
MKDIVPWFGLVPLAAILAFAVRQRLRRGSAPRYVLVSVGERSKWSTRPPVIRTQEKLALVQDIETEIEAAGFTARALVFLGKPTLDLIVKTHDPDRASKDLAARLTSFPVVVYSVGAPGEFRWVRRLWRHL